MDLAELFNTGMKFSRNELSASSGMDDRAVRNRIRLMRRSGIPIIAVRDGGYKLAETEAEKKQLLAMYRHRAIDELVTYTRLRNAMQIKGQLTLTDIADALEGIR